jgi:hypothetical protein
VLGAVTAKALQARFEIDRLARLLRRKESELRAIELASAVWKQEAQGWLRHAVELGLLPAGESIPSEWTEVIDLLREVASRNAGDANPTIQGMDKSLDRLELLRAAETNAASNLAQHRERLNELRRLVESSEAYGGAIRIQRDRLALSEWLRGLLPSESSKEPLGDFVNGRDQILLLCDSLAALELRLRTHPSISDTLDKEILRLRGLAEVAIVELNEIRGEMSSLERDSTKAREVAERFDRTERFLGRLEQALKLYDEADQSQGVREEVAELRVMIEALQGVISESEAKGRLRNALDRIEYVSGNLIPRLDAEWPDAPIRLMIDDLTIKVIRGNRDDYLWEIGSGANWLAYHVALTVALQKFFLAEPHHPVPGLLVYDQPSQVYFPRRFAGDEFQEPTQWRDQDVVAVRKVFQLLGEEALTARGRLQIVVLDHAGEEVWGGLPGVSLIEDWRGDALVPLAWLSESTT